MAEILLLYILRAVTWIFGHAPPSIALPILRALVKVALCLKPRYRRIADRNLMIAFPEWNAEQRAAIIEKSIGNLARVFHDACRAPLLPDAWFLKHIEAPFLHRYQEIKRERPAPGILFATGHLGSFELLAHYLPTKGHRMAFVVRNFKFPRVDAWWTSQREARGNQVISRAGAFRDMSELLGKGKDVGILFDQNVTKNHAVFVNFFGKLSATTRAPALAAVKYQCPVVVVGIVNLPGDKYRVDARECDFSAIYASPLSRDEKIEQITRELNSQFESMVRDFPEGWFWFHRRWRTRPENDAENPYHGS